MSFRAEPVNLKQFAERYHHIHKLSYDMITYYTKKHLDELIQDNIIAVNQKLRKREYIVVDPSRFIVFLQNIKSRRQKHD